MKLKPRYTMMALLAVILIIGLPLAWVRHKLDERRQVYNYFLGRVYVSYDARLPAHPLYGYFEDARNPNQANGVLAALFLPPALGFSMMHLVFAFVAVLITPAAILADETGPIRILFLGDNGPHRPARFAELAPVMATRTPTLRTPESTRTTNDAP
jgi:hypothetical protein